MEVFRRTVQNTFIIFLNKFEVTKASPLTVQYLTFDRKLSEIALHRPGVYERNLLQGRRGHDPFPLTKVRQDESRKIPRSFNFNPLLNPLDGVQ